jgi:alkylation response protein AidB-like acyl-CoA dehydrogenase
MLHMRRIDFSDELMASYTADDPKPGGRGMAAAVEGKGTPSRSELVAKTAALKPVLRQRALETEKNRRISKETLQDLVDAGLFHVGNPERFGGYGHEYDAVFDVAMELASACTSTGWCYAVWQSHNWMVGNFLEEAQEEYYAGGPDTVASTAVAIVRSDVRPVEGGFRLSGQWSFSSGCDSAEWLMLAARSADDRPMMQMMMLPASEATIVDNWYVSGLRGTGSKDIIVENIFIPTHRASSLGEHHGWQIHKRASYRLPLMTIWPYTLACPGVGAAQGAVEEFVGMLQGRRGHQRAAESVALQLRLAESSAEVDAARLVLREDCRELLRSAAEGHEFTPLEQARYRRNQAFVTKLCIEAVDRLFEASGGHALYEEHPMQRFHRDVHAIGHHTALSWDSSAEGFGRAMLDLPPTGFSFG